LTKLANLFWLENLMKILTASQMREVDSLTTSRYGISGLVLMENAGIGVVLEMEKHFGDLNRFPIAILCGKGNNGGDGLVVARQLIQRGISPQILLFADPAELKGDTRTNYEILEKMKVFFHTVPESRSTEERLQQLFAGLKNHIVVDGLLGTGTRLPIRGYYTAILEHLGKLDPIVSIDIPSGLDCDSLQFESHEYLAPRAELTITFTAPKPAHIFSPASDFSKQWVVLPIGSPAELLEEAGCFLNYFTASDAARTIARFRRSPSSHKGSYGHVLAIGGSLGKTGAASMMAQSALLAGAGLVTLATAAPCLPIIAAQTLEIMTKALVSTDTGALSHRAFEYGRMESILEGKDLLALGPGLGTHQETIQFVHQLLGTSKLPAILDADAINAFAGQAKHLRGENRTLVLTPHPGELGRLLGLSTQEVLRDRIQLARELATRQQVHLIVKGHRTLYAAPSGQVYVNSTGNPGMATGGSGDVLTGLLAGLLAQALQQKIPFEDTIPLGIWLHGQAGDLARKVKGEQSLIATDLMEHLPAAFCTIQEAAVSGRMSPGLKFP